MSETTLPTDAMIEEFWDFWADIKDELLDAIRTGTTHHYGGSLRIEMQMLHRGLSYAIQPGLTVTHSFAISGNDPASHEAAARVLAGAPPNDEHWEYTNLISAVADPLKLVCVVGDLTLRLADMVSRLAVFKAKKTMVVVLYHPLWGPLPDETKNWIANQVMGIMPSHLIENYRIDCLCSPYVPIDANLVGYTEPGPLGKPLDLVELAREMELLQR